ncbi:MAG: GtrA family protein [Firmicutes bacterium HGW-Firmicutes-1]|jgi:putative flippase GtrA|nr:MAG: GtrA family protein [Firmicutes bacterium HGW-Firmicutes-1]
MNIKKIINIFFNKEFMVFLIIGVINTFNGVGLALLYSYFADANLAFALGYGTSLLISYLLNSYFTFKESLGFVKLIKFCISYLPNFIIQFVTVLLFYNLLNFPKIYAYAVAAVIGVPITFLVLKFYAFAKKK